MEQSIKVMVFAKAILNFMMNPIRYMTSAYDSYFIEFRSGGLTLPELKISIESLTGNLMPLSFCFYLVFLVYFFNFQNLFQLLRLPLKGIVLL